MKVFINTTNKGIYLKYDIRKKYFDLKGWELGTDHGYMGEADPVIVIRKDGHRFTKSWNDNNIERTDSDFIKLIEENTKELGNFKIIEIPDDIDWVIIHDREKGYDREFIQEIGRLWS